MPAEMAILTIALGGMAILAGVLGAALRTVVIDRERAYARIDDLMDTIVAMRRVDRFDAPTKAGRVIEPPDPELLAKRRLDVEWTENYVRSAVAEGASEADARAEAAAMRDTLDYQQPETL